MKIEKIMLHHSAVSYKRNNDQFNANNEYHRAAWNFKSSLGYYLGYNYEISVSGIIRQARKDGEKTASCYQNNMNNGKCIHICMDGHFDIEKPKPNQIFALRDLLNNLCEKYNLQKQDIVLHRDYANKSCPGMNIDLNFIRSLVKNKHKEESKIIKEIKEDEEKKIIQDKNKNEEIKNLLNKALELLNK